MGGFGGNPVVASPFGAGGGGLGGFSLVSVQPGFTGVATDLAASTFARRDEPLYRRMVDLRAARTVSIVALISFSGDALTAANKVRVDYHLGENLGVAAADTGWRQFAISAGSHSAGTWIVTTPVDVPQAARVARCILRPGFYDGNGVADPVFLACHLLFT